MSTLKWTRTLVNPINFFVDHISTELRKYGLSKMTAGYVGDSFNVTSMHPLAMELGALLGAGEEGNYSSPLPAIGVEMINDAEDRQLLGRGTAVVEITQAQITAWAAMTQKQRIAAGVYLSDTAVASLQAMKTAKGTAPLYARITRHMKRLTMNVSAWSDNRDVTHLLYSTLDGIFMGATDALSAIGVKNLSVGATGGIYNYEFGKTLYGVEFDLQMTNMVVAAEVDTSLVNVDEVEEFWPRNELQSGVDGIAGPRFVATDRQS